MAVPKWHAGLHYMDLMADLSRKRSCKRYLEIGVCNGHLLRHIAAERAVGVDPGFQIECNIVEGKRSLALYQMTSDAFFVDNKILEGPFDLAFLDGLHTFEFLLRDFYNTEARSSPAGLIGMHDCLPLSTSMMARDQAEANDLSKGGDFPYWYTGDVWKIIFILRRYRPDLRITCVDSNPTGVVFISGLNPNSTVLSDKYFEIIDLFTSTEDMEKSLQHIYDSVDLIPAERVAKSFDHTLYFKV